MGHDIKVMCPLFSLNQIHHILKASSGRNLLEREGLLHSQSQPWSRKLFLISKSGLRHSRRARLAPVSSVFFPNRVLFCLKNVFVQGLLG